VYREEVGVVGEVEEDGGDDGHVGAEHDAGGEDLVELPRVGGGRRLDAVLGDGHDGAVVEYGDDEHHEGREVELPDERDEEEAQHDADGDGHGVDGVVLHALEDGAARQHGAHDHAQPGLSQHDVRRAPGRVRRVVHGDADVRLLQRRRVVHAVPGHAADVVPVLEPLHDLVLVLGEDPREAVRLLDQLVDVHAVHRGVLVAQERGGGVHVGAHAEPATGLLADGELVAGDHLHVDAQVERAADGLRAVVPRRVEQGQEANELPRVAGALLALLRHLLVRHAERPEAAVGVPVDQGMDLLLGLGAHVAELDDLLGSALANPVPVAVAVDVGDGRALLDRVEGEEVDLLDASAGLLGVGEHVDDAGVNGVLVLDAGGPRGVEEHHVPVDALGVHLDEGLVDGELVEGEGAGLVATEHVHAGHLLDGRHALRDGPLLRQAVGTDGHGDREHGGHGDGDAADEQDEEVVDAVAVRAVLDRVHDNDLDQHAGSDGDDAEVADGREHLLEVADVVGAVDEVRRLAEEGAHAGGDDDGLDLPLLDGGAREDLLPRVLVHGERLTGERRLVDLERVPLEQPRVGGDDVAELDADDVTGHQDRRVLLLPPAVPQQLGLGRQPGHERRRGVPGVGLLDVADGGVDEEQRDDADEVLPVGRPAAAVGERDGHDGRHLHDPRERVPHEAQELEEVVLLLLLQLVGPERPEPVLALRAGQPLAVAFQRLEHLLHRDLGLQIPKPIIRLASIGTRAGVSGLV
jgi:hypothetical protein